jgi:hypothetical protein
MKRVAAVALVMFFAVGCAGRNGGGRGSVIQRTADDSAQQDHSNDISPRPIGQR